MRELTWRGVILGALLTLLFTAANVYLGLKVGLTFATSIPAAVISMAVLKALGNSSIGENNIVQTIASAAGTLSAIIFVLPGLVMIGWWSGFPYWMSVAVIGLGGILGVMYSVPLRRALVTGSTLPYPEGVAAAEVLKVGAGVGGAEENRRGLRAILWSSIAAAGFSLLVNMKLIAGEAARAFRFGPGATSVSASLSLALIGVGHLVGLSVGIAMLVGLVISFFVLLPQFTAPIPLGVELADHVGTVFREQVRFVGAGTIGVAAIWTLLRIIGPVVKGLQGALAANRARKGSGYDALDLTERDLPISIVGGTILASMIPIGILLWDFAQSGPVAAGGAGPLLATIAYILVAGVVIAAVCGYMAGLIGASNSPISGVGILAVVGISLILAALFGRQPSPEATQALVAYALFVTAIVFGVATISNDNLQDLKTGQLVGATPWKQQVALVLGVIFGALVIPPVLGVLHQAFGFQGAPGAGAQALAAPQAALITSLAQGVLGGSLDWGLIGLGAGIGLAAVVIDLLLERSGRPGWRLPPLAVGMGIYLPMALTLLIPIGAILGHLYERWAERTRDPEYAKRLGVLAATGLIVGESLFGVAYAGVVAASGSDAPLAVVAEHPLAVPLGLALFAGLIAFLYHRTRRDAQVPVAAGDLPR